MSEQNLKNGKKIDDYVGDLSGLDFKNLWISGHADYVNGHNFEYTPTIQTKFSDDYLDYDVYDSHGNVILNKVRDYYMGHLFNRTTCHDAYQSMKGLYTEWVGTDTFIHLEMIRQGYDLLEMKPIEISEGDLLIKSAKRGNTVYRDRVKTRLEPIYSVSKDISRNKERNTTTNSIFVTLTCDTNRYDTFAHAWENIAKDWNRFITNVRNNFGDVSYFRIFESSKKLYPHIHAILIFHDTDFPVFQHKGRTRINPKGLFDNFWHSHIDLEGIRNMEGSIRYISKYITKDMNTLGNTDTVALMWFFRKRSYAISKSFIDLIHPFLHNSKIDYNYRLEFQIEYVYRGQIIADFIGRYENYIFADEDLRKRCDFYHDMCNPYNEILREKYHAQLAGW